MTTKDEIQTSINSRLTTSATKIEGGTVQDIIGSVSYELANIVDTRIDTILDNAFVTTADEEHLLIKGSELGIYQKGATSAFVKAKITNAAPKTTIGENIRAVTSDGIVFAVADSVKADEEGIATVLMVCLESGIQGNIEKNTLTEFYEQYTGLENAEITNEEEGYDGFDAEDIEEYRERILEYLKDDACNSNIADYIAWAKSVPGVKNVVVHDALTAGAGHVDIYISASNNENISDELIENVAAKIKKEQIINAIVSVYPLEYFEINVNANVVLAEGANIETVRYHFEELLSEYLNTKPSFVSYLYISNLLFETDGVEDISDYLLNGSVSGISLGELKVPVTGEIVINTI